MNPKAIDLALTLMDSNAFENLVFALVHEDEPGARQLSPPDVGRDTVVDLGNGRERAWQAKHHTDGIKWKDCEESLQTALDNDRGVVEMTFVFPKNMTKGKEDGLETLRSTFPEVRIPEPWTLGKLRERLLANDDLRRHHIDSVLALDRTYAIEMLERGAKVQERWTEQTEAALHGPLAILGLEKAVDDAEGEADRGDHAEASRQLELAAGRAAARMPAVGDVLMLRAARYAGESGDRSRAGGLYMAVSRSAARRGDDTAEYAAFRATWLLDDDERWRAHAAVARAAWPERPEESSEVLRDAFERSVANANADADADGIAEWADASCDAFAAQGAWSSVEAIASRAAAALGPVDAADARLEIELDLLDALAADGEETTARFQQLLLTALGRDDATAARIEARWGCALTREGRWPDARLRFREAARRWRAVAGSEDEVGEAVLSEDAASQLLGEGPVLDQPERIAIADLRGRDVSAAVLADRKEATGLRAWLTDRGHDARRALVTSWAIHRRAGHFGGCARSSELLQALFERAEEWPDALTWAIRSGQQVKAQQAAERLSWDQVHARLELSGIHWERGASFEAVAAAGAEASDEQVRTLIGPLLETAADHADEATGVKPGAAARRGLSTLLCAIAPERFDEALEHVLYELDHTPFSPDVTVNGLLLATDAGLCDAAEPIAEVFCEYDRMHVPGFSEALDVIRRSDAAKRVVEGHAKEGFTALVLAAWLGLPDDDAELADRAADVVARSSAGALRPEEILRSDDRGRLARWASPDEQAAVARGLVGDLSNAGDVDVHRYEAGNGLVPLASRLAPDVASAVLDELLGRWELIAAPSTSTGFQSHPNVHFARLAMRTPRATGPVVATAMRAACELAAVCDRLEELSDLVQGGIPDADGAIRAEGLRLAQRWPQLASVDFSALLSDEDPTVSSVALAACVERGEIGPDDARLLSASDNDAPLALRVAMLEIARNDPRLYRASLEQLASDPHGYVRAAARRAL